MLYDLAGIWDLDLFVVLCLFNRQSDNAMGSLQVEEPVHTSWSRFCTVNHRALAINYQLSSMKCLGQDLNRRPQRLKVSTLTARLPSPLSRELGYIQ